MFCNLHYALFFISVLQTSRGLYIQPKIVNGTDASWGEYPYAVSVRYFGFHECGGSIIGDVWVLTAAHCVYPNLVDNATILYGTTDLQNGESPENHIAEVIQLFQHECYTAVAPSYENDIGLIKLKKPLKFNGFARPVRLAESTYATPAEQTAVLVGWGFGRDEGNVSEILQKVELKVYSEDSCYKAHGGAAIPAVHICAGVPEGGMGQCTGDSGGPLTVNGTQYGIVSWSVKPCATAGFPGVFTKVTNFRRWIMEKTGV